MMLLCETTTVKSELIIRISKDLACVVRQRNCRATNPNSARRTSDKDDKLLHPPEVCNLHRMIKLVMLRGESDLTWVVSDRNLRSERSPGAGTHISAGVLSSLQHSTCEVART
ncbi:hypothetical protein GW17_00033837 [Ensete ventricosum]|nr:hypothetical protein GW17_00033837 [Ensete ventricosum]